MKKHLMSLLAMALLVVAVGPASAQPASQIVNLSPNSDGFLKWSRGAGLIDSTRISITVEGTSNDFADTTQWVELANVKSNQTFTEQTLGWFQIYRQLASGTDSVGYQVQLCNDLRNSSTIFAPLTVGTVVGVSATTAGITSGSDGFVTNVKFSSPKTAATNGTASDFPWKYARLVVQNRTGNRVYFKVGAFAYGWK